MLLHTVVSVYSTNIRTFLTFR